MSLFSRLFYKKPLPFLNTWPNHSSWAAMKNGQTLETEDGPRFMFTTPCGDLALPSGRLIACDPFACLSPSGMPFVRTPKGRFPVVVTLADVSEKQDRSHLREAYASILFSSDAEVSRKALPLLTVGETPPKLDGDDFLGFAVDAGTACFVDESAVASCMPDPSTWNDDLFDNNRPDCWFRQMDDPHHIRAGIANIALPLAKNGENLILFHSGWGDGHFPVIGGYSAAHQLVAIHIDFFVVK